MPTIITRGAMTARGYGFGASAATAANYIEDVFSTYLYTGTASAQTITNGIDLSGKGGMVWLKSRSGADSHYIVDTARGSNKVIYSNLTIAEETLTRFSSFNSNGFSLSTTPSNPNVNGYTYASWTFRKQAKFFDVVTYTGNGTSGRQIAHNLGSTPGCIIVKCTSTATAWAVYHRSLNIAGGHALMLNVTDASASLPTFFNSTVASDTTFTVGDAQATNQNTLTYVAYLFAHDAGGFGAAGTDNVISCGSFTTDGSGNATVSLGYEPQWVLVKRSSGTSSWIIVDTMRGFPVGNSNDASLYPNLADAENNTDSVGFPNATGFNFTLGSASSTYIYIAIRRGPMKTPTSGTSVFGLNARTGTGANATVTGGQTDDAILVKNRGRVQESLFSSRLTGTGYLSTSSTAAEAAAGTTILQASPWDVMDGVKLGTTSYFTNATADTFINYLFRRAPGFFDEVCWTPDGATVDQQIPHNLTVVPELIISKSRVAVQSWLVYSATLGTGKLLTLNTSDAALAITRWGTPTSTYFILNNQSANPRVAYLFASCPGVSKVGSFTGTGSTLQVNCGFTGGARFVLIKRTDSTGDWYVWDSARGIVAGNDPYLLLNSTAAEVTGTDYVDTYSAGFEISSTAPAAINANGGTFIFLAIA